MSPRLDTNNLANMLTQEIRSCHAPVTGYLVTCALLTDHGVYLGHNIEHENPTVFEHAESVAIQKMLQSETQPIIRKIVMYGGGNVKKFKYYIPCFSCTHELAPYIQLETPIHLLPLEGYSEHLEVTFSELIASYADLPYSKLAAGQLPELLRELKHKTLLQGTDLSFVADLTMFARQHDIEIYLTGSSTGRGAVSKLIMEKTGHPYRDIDIIAASHLDLAVVESGIEQRIKQHYGFFRKEPRPIPPHQNLHGVVRQKTFYHCGPDQKIIDFTLSSDFKGSFHYRSYELKNWFHQLA